MDTKNKVHAFMRFKHVKFTHILLPHIHRAVQQVYPKIGTPVVSVKVQFSDNGEPYGATWRANGHTLGFVNFINYTLSPAFDDLSGEVTQYLIQASKEALRIVEPIITTH